MQKIAKYLIKVLENYVRNTTVKESKPSRIGLIFKKIWKFISSTFTRFNKFLMHFLVYRRLMTYSHAIMAFILSPLTWILSVLESQREMAEIYDIALKKLSKVAIPDANSPFADLSPSTEFRMEVVNKDIIGYPDISKSDYEHTLRTIKEDSEKMRIPGQIDNESK